MIEMLSWWSVLVAHSILSPLATSLDGIRAGTRVRSTLFGSYLAGTCDHSSVESRQVFAGIVDLLYEL